VETEKERIDWVAHGGRGIRQHHVEALERRDVDAVTSERKSGRELYAPYSKGPRSQKEKRDLSALRLRGLAEPTRSTAQKRRGRF